MFRLEPLLLLMHLSGGIHGKRAVELTGKNIPKARLEAIPWTRFTVDAQAQLEKDGALKSRRIGQLGTVDGGSVTEVETDEDEPEEKPAKEKE